MMMDNLLQENLRLNRMTQLVFTGSSLKELRYAVQDVFEIFYDILMEPITSYRDLKHKLKSVSEEHWDRIRQVYIHEDMAGYCRGDFTEKEKNSVVKLLLDFLFLLDKCSQAVLQKVEDKQREVKVLEGKLNAMEERIKKMDSVMESQNAFYSEKISENNDYAAQNMHLLQQIAAKNKQITELERGNNIQLWEKEKEKLLNESSEKIQELEKDLEDLRQHSENYKRRMSSIDSSYKQLRMKNKLQSDRTNSPIQSGDENEEKSCKLSKQNFMQDKDIVYLEKKLYDLQTTTCGVIGGIKTDFNQLAPSFVDPEEGKLDDRFRILSGRMDRIYKAVADADVEKVKDGLPAHYRYLEDDNFKVKKIRRLSQPVAVPNLRVLNSILDEKTVLKPIPPSKERQGMLNGIKEVPINPIIIDPVTKKLHPIHPLRHFPFMSQQFIKDQFEKFKEYDKNGDASLDISEMVDIVKELGFEFNVHQLQDAMEEVDRDGNHTLDFYEYMLVIDNIYRKRGKADLFQMGMKEVRRTNMSKSCVIQ